MYGGFRLVCAMWVDPKFVEKPVGTNSHSHDISAIAQIDRNSKKVLTVVFDSSHVINSAIG